MSELIEQTIGELAETKCIASGEEAAIARGWAGDDGRVRVPSGMDPEDIEVLVEPLNLGLVSSYYGVRHSTMDIMHASLSARTKLKGLLEILCASQEVSSGCPLRRGEEVALRRQAAHLPLSLPKEAMYDDPATKANVLLQSYFSRIRLNGE